MCYVRFSYSVWRTVKRFGEHVALHICFLYFSQERERGKKFNPIHWNMLKYYCKRIRAGLIFALLIFILDVLYCDKTRGKNSVSLSGIFDNGVFDPRGEKFWLCIVWKYATYLGHTKPVSPGNLCSSYRDGVWGSRFFFLPGCGEKRQR